MQVPRVTWQDSDGDGVREPHLMITEAAVDIIHFPVFLPPQSITIYHRFYDPVGSGSAPAGATLFQLGADPGIAVWMASGKWQAFHYNGSSSVSSAATVVTTATDLVADVGSEP